MKLFGYNYFNIKVKYVKNFVYDKKNLVFSVCVICKNLIILIILIMSILIYMYILSVGLFNEVDSLLI